MKASLDLMLITKLAILKKSTITRESNRINVFGAFSPNNLLTSRYTDRKKIAITQPLSYTRKEAAEVLHQSLNRVAL